MVKPSWNGFRSFYGNCFLLIALLMTDCEAYGLPWLLNQGNSDGAQRMNRSEAQFMRVVWRKALASIIQFPCRSSCPQAVWWDIAALALKNPLKQHNLINERPKLSLSLLKPQLEGGLRVGNENNSNRMAPCKPSSHMRLV